MEYADGVLHTATKITIIAPFCAPDFFAVADASAYCSPFLVAVGHGRVIIVGHVRGRYRSRKFQISRAKALGFWLFAAQFHDPPSFVWLGFTVWIGQTPFFKKVNSTANKVLLKTSNNFGTLDNRHTYLPDTTWFAWYKQQQSTDCDACIMARGAKDGLNAGRISHLP